eukprot:TRINITY_DN27392_c0_g1_i1.p1 TRINITY_DN27392_c0_g1~~TRINITY_DN27392_c0_g1_i1.p1  ORF type:complete len:271 (+),score=39.67 TRINITY_DN27392_c0_g1_i1:410-1222(+)
MTLASFVGYVLIGLGPGLALFSVVVASKPLLVLVMLSSASFWLLNLMLVAALWRPFIPLGPSAWPHALLLLSAVAIQEGARLFFWKIFRRAQTGLEGIAAAYGRPRLSVLDKVELAVSAGLGHGAAHSALFFVSLLTPVVGSATYYTHSCPQLPFFLVAALMSLALLLLHTFSTLLAFDAFVHGPLARCFWVPAAHLLASLAMLVNFFPGGCVLGLPLVWLCTATIVWLAGWAAWDRVGCQPFLNASGGNGSPPASSSSGALQRLHHGAS